MCDDHVSGTPAGDVASGLSRRNFIHGSAALAAAVAVFREMPRLPLNSPARAAAADGGSAYSMAMHIHSSFSEQSGSMDSQLFQAAKNAVDVLWWTDHDHRMDGTNYRDEVHFTSLTSEQGGPGQGKAWTWTKQQSGSLASGSGGIVTSPSSPSDPVSGGSMHLSAKSSGGGSAKFGYYANTHPAAWNYRDNLTGQTLTIDVMLASGWTKGYLELLITTSYHQASGGRPAGDYSLSYRFVPSGSGSRTASGNQGVITIPVSAGGSWHTEAVTPSADIAALWPDLDYRDFALWELTLSAVSTGDSVSGYFDYLRFNRSISGQAFFSQQADMQAVLAPKYPGVAQQQGLEVSLLLPHLNWFGNNITVPDYTTIKPSGYQKFLAQTVVPEIHSSGGLVSYNHPFGYSSGNQLPASQQDTLLSQVAAKLLPSGGTAAALGCDLLEVGYILRSGVNLAHHVALWDVMSRNAIFLTGNGTSDDHFGTNWRGIQNNWITSAWAASTSQPDLLTALAAGRVWCGALSAYRGTLDLLADGSAPMGSVSVSTVGSRQLALTATGVPSGGSLQVLQGDVDFASTSGLSSNAKVIQSYPASSLSGGSATLTVDNSTGSYVRTQVADSSGNVIALSNPVWLLRSAPPGGIPVPRGT